VEGDRLLSGIHRDERRRHAVVASVVAVVAQRVSTGGLLDLDHSRTQEPQQVRCERTCHHVRKIGHDHAVERLSHYFSSVQFTVPSGAILARAARLTAMPSISKRASSAAISSAYRA